MTSIEKIGKTLKGRKLSAAKARRRKERRKTLFLREKKKKKKSAGRGLADRITRPSLAKPEDVTISLSEGVISISQEYS